MRFLSNFAVALALLLPSAAFAQGYICAEGGGNANRGTWSEEVFGWMVEKGKGGHVVVLGAIPLEEDSRPDLFKKLGAASAVGLVVDETNADTQETYDAIAAASVVFIRGGSQSRYVQMWKGTKTEQAIHAVFKKGGVIGGTSAGLAVLGEVTYDAIHGSLKPIDILRDARHPDLTLTKGFLNLVPGVLFDSHFTERGRLPRLVVMLAHCRDLMNTEVIGIGVDPRTAVCIEPDGTATVKGEGTVTILELSPGTKTRLDAGRPPAVTSVWYTHVPAGAKLDTTTWAIKSPLEDHVPTETEATLQEIVFDGAGPMRDAAPAEGEQPRLVRQDWPVQGSGNSPVHVSMNTWATPSQAIEAVVSYLIASPGKVGLLLGTGNSARASGEELLIEAGAAGEPASALLIDSRSVRQRPPSRLKLDESVCRAKLHLVPPGWGFDVCCGKVTQPE
jgi:cyanophycinase